MLRKPETCQQRLKLPMFRKITSPHEVSVSRPFRYGDKSPGSIADVGMHLQTPKSLFAVHSPFLISVVHVGFAPDLSSCTQTVSNG
jgi:hypothetical protein